MPMAPPVLRHAAVRSRAQFDAERVQARASRRWYRTARWQKRRARQLAREPLCVRCAGEGLMVAASVADHIVPHRDDPALFWEGELQSLCASCHSSAKQREERGAGKTL